MDTPLNQLVIRLVAEAPSLPAGLLGSVFDPTVGSSISLMVDPTPALGGPVRPGRCRLDEPAEPAETGGRGQLAAGG